MECLLQKAVNVSDVLKYTSVGNLVGIAQWSGRCMDLNADVQSTLLPAQQAFIKGLLNYCKPQHTLFF